MTTPTPEIERRIARVLLALDAASHAPASVESAVQLAARLQAELLGLFIEDADLLRSAQLPFSQEVGLSTASERHLGGGELERALHSFALQTERELGEAADRARVRWSFRTLRGRPLQSALEQLDESSLLVLGWSRRGRWHHPEREPAYTIYILCTYSETSRHAAEVAARAVAGNHGEVVLLETAPGQAMDEARVLHARRTPGRTRTVTDPDALPEALREPPPWLLLVPADHPLLEDRKAVERLLNRLECPVLVVR